MGKTFMELVLDASSYLSENELLDNCCPSDFKLMAPDDITYCLDDDLNKCFRCWSQKLDRPLTDEEIECINGPRRILHNNSEK